MFVSFSKIVLLSAALILLFIPVILLQENWSVTNTTDLIFAVHRIVGLYAFFLIFIQIILGSGMGLLSKIFTTKLISNLHQRIGKLAFTLVLAHPILLFATYFPNQNFDYVSSFWNGTNFIFFACGVIALLLLTISVATAIFRQSIGKNWIYIHRINYLIFWLIFYHSYNLGTDTKASLAQNIYLVFAVVVGFLTLRKLFNWGHSYLTRIS